MTDSATHAAMAGGLTERVFNVRLAKGEVLRERRTGYGETIREPVRIPVLIIKAICVVRRIQRIRLQLPSDKAEAYHTMKMLAPFQLKYAN
jgi:hypothetical protein